MLLKGKVNNGQLELENVGRLRKFEGTEIECIIRKRRRKRSLPQNSYYWGVIVQVASDETGYYPNEIHAYHKEFLWLFKPKIIKMFGVEIEEERSTTRLSRAEFSEWCDYLRNFWGQQDIYIPAPNEVPVELYEQVISGENDEV